MSQWEIAVVAELVIVIAAGVFALLMWWAVQRDSDDGD